MAWLRPCHRFSTPEARKERKEGGREREQCIKMTLMYVRAHAIRLRTSLIVEFYEIYVQYIGHVWAYPELLHVCDRENLPPSSISIPTPINKISVNVVTRVVSHRQRQKIARHLEHNGENIHGIICRQANKLSVWLEIA